MRRVSKRVAIGSVTAAVLLSAGAVVALAPSSAYAQAVVTIDGATELQTMDGFGISQAFQRARIMNGSQGLSPARQQEILDLLFHRETGAGSSILRLGIGSSPDYSADHMRSIQPTNPGGPNATPRYSWDGDDGGQVWIARKAREYGVERFYADAWSAPGYMKTNGNDANGGTLCGVPGAGCASGDWRQAYANYLIQYTKFYEEEGIKITDIGFLNEPDLTVDYASMRFNPQQAVDFIKILGPLAAANDLAVACCDAAGWSQQRGYSQAIEADPTARDIVATHTGHPYVSGLDGPLPTRTPTWMSEWSPNGNAWNENWDDGSGFDGMTVAQSIHDFITRGNVTGYVYWFGASTGTTRGFIQMTGDSYRVSKRLWAFSQYSRYIRPEAVRIGANSQDPNLRTTAYRNTDGSVVVVALNAGRGASNVSFSLRDTGIDTGTAAGYVTNQGASMAAQPEVPVSGGSFTGSVPARSLATFVIRAPEPAPTAEPTVAPVPTPSAVPAALPPVRRSTGSVE